MAFFNSHGFTIHGPVTNTVRGNQVTTINTVQGNQKNAIDNSTNNNHDSNNTFMTRSDGSEQGIGYTHYETQRRPEPHPMQNQSHPQTFPLPSEGHGYPQRNQHQHLQWHSSYESDPLHYNLSPPNASQWNPNPNPNSNLNERPPTLLPPSPRHPSTLSVPTPPVSAPPHLHPHAHASNYAFDRAYSHDQNGAGGVGRQAYQYPPYEGQGWAQHQTSYPNANSNLNPNPNWPPPLPSLSSPQLQHARQQQYLSPDSTHPPSSVPNSQHRPRVPGQVHSAPPGTLSDVGVYYDRQSSPQSPPQRISHYNPFRRGVMAAATTADANSEGTTSPSGGDSSNGTTSDMSCDSDTWPRSGLEREDGNDPMEEENEEKKEKKERKRRKMKKWGDL